MKYPNDFVNKIVCADVLKAIRYIPDTSVDLIVTSPPYNLKNSTGNGMKDGRGGKWANAALQQGYSHHNDCMPHDAYVKWQRTCLEEMVRVLKDDGAIFTSGACKMVYCRIEAIFHRFSGSTDHFVCGKTIFQLSMRK